MAEENLTLDSTLAANRPMKNVRVKGNPHPVEAVRDDESLRCTYISHVLRTADKARGMSTLGKDANMMVVDEIQLACMRLANVALPVDADALEFLNKHAKGKDTAHSREALAALQHINMRRASSTPARLQGPVKTQGTVSLTGLPRLTR